MHRRQHHSILILSIFIILAEAHISDRNPIIAEWFRRMSMSSYGSPSSGGWLWGWPWGTDGEVTVVERSPSISFDAKPASFGPFLDDPILGYVIPMSSFARPCQKNNIEDRSNGSLALNSAEDNFGCPDLCIIGPHEPERIESWIALVQRGRCQFSHKVREAQKFGAKAVIIGGDDPELSGNPDTLVNMYSPGDSSDITIPSTFIKFSDYQRLSRLIAESNTTTSGIQTLYLQLVSHYSSWEWYSPILTFLLLLLLPSTLTMITLLIHRLRAARQERRERAPEDIVNSLPWRVWSDPSRVEKDNTTDADKGTAGSTPNAVDGAESPIPRVVERDLERGTSVNDFTSSTSVPADSGLQSGSKNAIQEHLPSWFASQSECAICISDFVNGDRIRVLPCRHIFHMDEIDAWLTRRKKTCPICKADVTESANESERHISPESDVHQLPYLSRYRSLLQEYIWMPSLPLTRISFNFRRGFRITRGASTERTPLLSDSTN